MTDYSDFLSPRSRYYGTVKPENLVFNANLQEFSHRASILCALESNGKITPEETYKELETLWKKLKRSKKQLRIGKSSLMGEENSAEEG